MSIEVRSFLKGTGAMVGGSTLGALGFADSEQALAASVRPFKLERTTETRNTCPYCSVSCGVIMYSLGDRAKNATPVIMHIEGDPDHPVNRGTLCPRARRCSSSCTPIRARSARCSASPAPTSSSASPGTSRSIASRA